MAKQKTFNDFGGLVFSTNPDAPLNPEPEEESIMDPKQQVLRIWLERGKGGKESTVVKGFSGPEAQLNDLSKLLKTKCASGGNAKNGIIILQGDHRDKIIKMLVEMGYSNTKKAGG